MSIITDTLNRLQSSRAQHSARSRKPQPESSDSSERPHRPVAKPTGRSSKFLVITALIGLTLTVMGTAGYWWGRNIITSPPPTKQKTLTLKSPEPITPTVGRPPTPTETGRDAEGLGSSSAEPTSDPETSVAQSRPEASQETLTSMATRPDSKPTVPKTGPSGPSRSEGKNETSRPSSGTASPSGKTSPSAQPAKGTTQDIHPIQTVSSQPGTSSSSSSDHHVEEKRSHQSARRIKEPAVPERSSPSSDQTQGQRKPSEVKNSPALQLSPSEVAPPNSLPTNNTRPTPNVARASLSTPHSRDTSPRYPLTTKQRMTKGKFLIRKRLYEEAVKVLDPLFESQPPHWEPWFWMGTAYLGLRDLEQAETFLMEGLVRDDTVPHLWVQQGLVYQLQEKHEKAIGAFRHAELLAPDFPEVHLNLAHVLESQGNGPLALKYYRKYLTLTEKALENRSIRKKVLGKIAGLEGS